MQFISLQERIEAQDSSAQMAQLNLRGVEQECEFVKRYRDQLIGYIALVKKDFPQITYLENELKGLVHEVV